MLLKEIGIGLGLAALAFLLLTGQNATPVLFVVGAAGAAYYLAQARGLLPTRSEGQQQVAAGSVSFADIGGQAPAIRELGEALDFLRERSRVQELGIRPLKGILLTGPPGTGKTLLARAAAAYTDAVFLASAGSGFVEMYAGVGAQRVRKLFGQARDMARRQNKENAVVFIDEIEILGGKRGQSTSHLEYDQTLNQLLVEMDGIQPDDRVSILVIGATNRADMLDAALLRPGRFDRQVKVDLPDKTGRLEILSLHTRNKPLAADVSLEEVARQTLGFSGAHLESVTNEAAILAMREEETALGQRHFMEAIDKVIMGERLDRRPGEDEMYRVAVHEAGHALVSEVLRPGSVSAVTVTSRGNALGYMRANGQEDNYLHSKEQLEEQIAVTLGGAAAEEFVCGSRSTGSGGDIEQALAVAETILKSGMSRLGVVGLEKLPRQLHHETVSALVQEQEERVRNIIAANREALLQTGDVLREKERVSGEELRVLLGRGA
ncbi:MAG TPA: AAA family ATPase [Spirochaetia bacterium]|nr:AAA family ATPase [Spirochaetia bacterium]